MNFEIEISKSQPINPVNYQDNNLKESAEINSQIASRRMELQTNHQDPSLIVYQRPNRVAQLSLQKQPQYEPVNYNFMPATTNIPKKVTYSPPGIEDKKSALAEINSLNSKPLHNPITNPLPYSINNPYLLRQLQSHGRGQSNQYPSYLANVASSNLMKC